MEFWLGLSVLVGGAAIIALIGWIFTVLFYVIIAGVALNFVKAIFK